MLLLLARISTSVAEVVPKMLEAGALFPPSCHDVSAASEAAERDSSVPPLEVTTVVEALAGRLLIDKVPFAWSVMRRALFAQNCKFAGTLPITTGPSA